MITFSLKPMTLRDWALVDRVKASDTQALIELIARRADPAITEAQVGEMTMAEATEAIQGLGKSLESMARLDTMVSDALKDAGR